MERLQKVIANLGYASRRKAEELIVAGRVKVNGDVITELGTKVKTSDIIFIDDAILDNNKNYEYYLLYKPREVISSSNDEHDRKTVVSMINTTTRIYPVGRLDYDTTGLILLTNDGELTNKLTHPSSNIEKKYVAKVSGIVSGVDIKKLSSGIIIDGKKTSKAKVKLKSIDKKNNKSIVELTIHEGRNHQVRKMFESLGYDVLKLKREKYANLDLSGLRAGEYRKLSNKEVAILYSMVK
ncbi:MAG: rRNA pseudouridine synthase [Bacilli bacterium]|nr:rRNA pseudouridine synthase [Bacilli bacterium]